jgi:hypothetical protein
MGEFLIELAVREVKMPFAGGEWWNARTGADLKAVFETVARVAVSRNGWRTVKDMLVLLLSR